MVFAKSWLLNWWLSDSEEDETSGDSTEEENAEESFVFPDPDENPPLLAVEEETEAEMEEEVEKEEDFDPNKAFIEYEFEVEATEELPSFGFLVETLLDQTQH